mmetsp:Transcript_9079/g.20067  ORF Transcript_9079/g.20067 Transcript_9079/m.20067 type:complete len:199 (-) Transcript_9079:426-1022(-)
MARAPPTPEDPFAPAPTNTDVPKKPVLGAFADLRTLSSDLLSVRTSLSPTEAAASRDEDGNPDEISARGDHRCLKRDIDDLRRRMSLLEKEVEEHVLWTKQNEGLKKEIAEILLENYDMIRKVSHCCYREYGRTEILFISEEKYSLLVFISPPKIAKLYGQTLHEHKGDDLDNSSSAAVLTAWEKGADMIQQIIHQSK